jgi:adenine-specific DNA-methyltransferase
LSAIDDLIAQVLEPRLREHLKHEWAEAQETKKLGLVFDRHLPELVPIPKARPGRGDLVAKRPTNGSGFSLIDLWRVRRVSGPLVQGVPPRPAPPGCCASWYATTGSGERIAGFQFMRQVP